MVIKNDNQDSDNVVINQGNANNPWTTVSGPDLRIVKQSSAEDPISIIESSTGERFYTFGPVFEYDEEARLFAEHFEELSGISLAEFLAPLWEAYEQFVAEQKSAENPSASNE